MIEFFNRHYASVDGTGRIQSIWSDGPHPEIETSEAICINEQGSYQVYLTVNGKRTEENPAWLSNDGIPLYKWEDGEVLERTQEEIEADREALPKPEVKPSPEARIAELEATLAALLGGEVHG